MPVRDYLISVSWHEKTHLYCRQDCFLRRGWVLNGIYNENWTTACRHCSRLPDRYLTWPAASIACCPDHHCSELHLQLMSRINQFSFKLLLWYFTTAVRKEAEMSWFLLSPVFIESTIGETSCTSYTLYHWYRVAPVSGKSSLLTSELELGEEVFLKMI